MVACMPAGFRSCGGNADLQILEISEDTITTPGQRKFRSKRRIWIQHCLSDGVLGALPAKQMPLLLLHAADGDHSWLRC